MNNYYLIRGTSEPLSNTPGKMEKENILIADASDKTRNELKILLAQTNGYEIIDSDNGIDAVEKSLANLPDLIIMGIDMPGMNGYQACRLIKNDPAANTIPLILLGSENCSGSKYLGVRGTPDDIFPENYDPSSLTETIKRRLGEKQPRNRTIQKNDLASSDQHTNVIARLNNLLDKKIYEADLFTDLTGLVQNIFSYDDLALAIMDVLAKLADFSVAMIVVVTEDESKQIVHLHKDVEKTSYQKMKDISAKEFEGKIEGFDSSNLWTKTVREDRIVDETIGAETNCESSIIFSTFSNNGLLKKGFLLFGKEQNKIDEKDLELVNTVVNEACIILENSWLYGKLYKNIKNLTITDGLTGIYNHKYIMGVVKQEFVRAKRYRHNISIIMFDIDHFKNINDTYGHQTGDVVLREISSIIKDSVRKSDIVGRYGGEEFTIILTETDRDKATVFAERLRKRVEAYKFFNPSDPLKITASMGLVCYPLESSIDDPKSFLRCADEALYVAKDGGRNKVCLYSKDGAKTV